MRVALVRSGVVENIAEVGEHYKPPSGISVVPHETANIGDRFLGERHIQLVPPGDERVPLIHAAENKVRMLQVDDECVHVRLPSRDVTVDVRLGRNMLNLYEARRLAEKDSNRVFRRHFAVKDGTDVYTVNLSSAELIALTDVLLEHQEKLEKAGADIIDEIHSGRITRLDQIRNHPKWPDRHTGLELHG